MAASDNSIETLRRDIDKLDDAIHDLLMRRAKLAERIGAAKSRGGERRNFMRASREAHIMRRLAARHAGAFPLAAVLRIWREIMAGTLSIEGPQSVAACSPPADWSAAAYDRMLRDHFGSCMPLARLDSPAEVLATLAARRASVGVLPGPRAGEATPWWPALIGGPARDRPRVVAFVPYLLAEAGAGAPSALVLALGDPEPTGEDAALLAVASDPATDVETLTRLLRDAGLAGRWQAEAPGADGARLHLFRIADYLAPGDPRLEAAERAGRGVLASLDPLGGFPLPLAGEAAP